MTEPTPSDARRHSPGSARDQSRFAQLRDRVTGRGRAKPGESEALPATVDVEERLAALERRITDLESLLEGLQDSVHREAVRREGDIEELRKKTLPGEIARALGEHGRRHGL